MQTMLSPQSGLKSSFNEKFKRPALQQNVLEIQQELLGLLVSELSRRIPEKRGISHCLQICERYWSVFRKSMIDYPFQDTDEEILFFKKLKPLFTNEIIYFKWTHKAIVRCPKERNRTIAFYEDELSSLKKIFVQHKDFYTYYVSGDSNKDLQYFTKGISPIFCDFDCLPIETELSISSEYDMVVAYILAYKKFKEFIRQKLAKNNHFLIL